MQNFNVFHLVALIIIIVMIGLPIIFKLFPPKGINSIYGYRTCFSMLNEDTWQEANTYSTNMNLKISGFLTLIAIILFFVLPSMILVFILIISMLASRFLTIYLTSKHLDKVFDKNGNRK